MGGLGINLSPEWGAVLAVVLLFGALALTHIINIRIGG